MRSPARSKVRLYPRSILLWALRRRRGGSEGVRGVSCGGIFGPLRCAQHVKAKRISGECFLFPSFPQLSSSVVVLGIGKMLQCQYLRPANWFKPAETGHIATLSNN